MNDADRLDACPDPVVLASFVEGTLDERSRVDVERHVALCAECPVIIGETVRFLRAPAEREALEGAAPAPSWRWLAAVAALAVFFIPATFWHKRDPLRRMKQISAQLPFRSLEARLTGFHYSPYDPDRSSASRPDDIAVRAEAARIAEERGTGAQSLHARGVALLLSGDPVLAIDLLSSATRANPRSAPAWCDLAAAYIAIGGRSELAKALDTADRAVVLAPEMAEAHFNRGLALQNLGRRTEAVDAYRAALLLDGRSQWREELEFRIAALTG